MYKSILVLSACAILCTGCSVTNPSPPSSEAMAKLNSQQDAPPRVMDPVSTSDADISATYSTASGNGMMTQGSVSISAPGRSGSMPTIPNAGSAAASHGQNLATGFSVKMNYDDAWSKTAAALPSAGYPVMEKDDLTGTYYVLDKVGSGGKIERDTPIYQVRLTRTGDSSTKVMLLNSDSQPATRAVSNRILGALKGKLS
jgi:uncharacterized lipoprotein